MENLYNRRVRSRTFRARDLVLRRVFENKVDPAVSKFQLNWERSYMIVKVGAVGPQALNKLESTPIPRICILRGIINKVLLFKKNLPLKCFLSIFATAPMQKTKLMDLSLLALS